MKKILIITLVIASLVLSSCAKKTESENNTEKPQTEQGNQAAEDTEKIAAPDFELSTLSGKKVKLSDLKGKIVVMNFFATWCPPCKAELPDFMQVMEEYKGKPVEFLFIDVQEEKKTVEEFLKSRNYEFDPLMDNDAEVFAYIYGLRGTPTTFIIDKEGYFVEGISGQTNKTVLKAAIEKGLKR